MTLKNLIGKEVDQYSKHKKAIIFVVFLLVVSSLAYFAFFEGKITPRIISSIGSNSEINQENSIKINANLIQPDDDLIIKGKIDKIEMKISKIDNFLYAGKSKFDLNQLSETYIIIFDYNGELSFNNENILKLKGKSSKILINGISATPTSDDMKIYFDDDVEYNYLKVNNIFLSPLSYITSGSIDLNDGKININIDKEEIKLGKFRGDVEACGEEFRIWGETERLEVVGILDIKI